MWTGNFQVWVLIYHNKFEKQGLLSVFHSRGHKEMVEREDNNEKQRKNEKMTPQKDTL